MTKFTNSILLVFFFAFLSHFSIQAAENNTTRILIFHKTNGFRHGGAIDKGIALFEDLGSSNGWLVDNTQDATVFSDANLSTYDLVIWHNTSGNNLLSSTEQEAFENFIRNGGKFMGIHAATDTYRNGSWPFYNELVGAIVQTSPNHTANNFNANMDVLISDHPSVDHLAQVWNKNEEYYYWEQNGGQLSDDNSNVLIVESTGSNSYDESRPMAWFKNSITVNGEDIPVRSFYTALGHNGSDYENNVAFQDHLEGAIQWLLTDSNTPQSTGEISGELQQWHKVTLTFDGPNTSETDATNPFTDYRLLVTFTNGSDSYIVPGYYAADGNAAETSANSGNKWNVHFAPDKTGTWTYSVSFKQGTDIALSMNLTDGDSAGFMDGATGNFNITASDKSETDHRKKGRLNYVGEHYLQYAGTGEYFIKMGSDAPENTLAYEDFDDVPNRGNRRKSWNPHAGDYENIDSNYTWQNGKGSELLGAINYLSNKGMNVFSFLTMSLHGDDENVFPHLLKVPVDTYNGYGDSQQWSDGVHHDRFDVSRLAQWEKIFEFADKEGMFMHFKTLETENDNIMDGNTFGRERQIYYRELIARFGHHLALNWNLSEEITLSESVINQTADYIKSVDPYDHIVVFHTYPGQDNRYDAHLGPNNSVDGTSLQTSNAEFTEIRSRVLEWINKSAAANKKWIVSVDEPGNASIGVNSDPAAREVVREKVTWNVLMAGGTGAEYYYGYQSGCGDLQCQDHRSRDQKYTDASYALQFFRSYLPFHEMQESDDLTTDGNDYVFAKADEVYAVFRPDGGSTAISLPSNQSWNLQWYNPRTGEMNSNTTSITNQLIAPDNNDWVALITIGTCNNSGACDDGDVCTINDTWDASCNCTGTFQDTDDDGVCDADDVCDGGDDNQDADNDGIPDFCDVCSDDDEGSACDDEDDCTINDVLDADCNCSGTFQDTDQDGVCDADDICNMLDDNLIGKACDDMDASTSNDVYTSNCICKGTIISQNPIFFLINANTDLVIRELTDNGVINLSTDGSDLNINAVFDETLGSVRFAYDNNSNFQTENVSPYALAGDTGGNYKSWTPTVGSHTLTATAYSGSGASGDQIASGSINFTVLDDCATVDQSCDDQDPCTINDVYDLNCNCTGTFQDSDMDGVCDADDVCENFDDQLIGTACDDNDPCTINDTYDLDCLCMGTFEDTDGDGICDFEDETNGDCTLNASCGDDMIYDENCNCISVSSEITLEFSAIHDAYLQNGRRFNTQILRVENGKRISYLQFDLSEIQGTITSATLEMTVNQDPGHGRIIVEEGDSEAWLETNISDANKPMPVQLLGELDKAAYNKFSMHEWDLDGVTGGGLYSILVTHTSGNDVSFNSDEHANAIARPKLTITYTPNTALASNEPFTPKVREATRETLLSPNPSSNWINLEFSKDHSSSDQETLILIHNANGQRFHQSMLSDKKQSNLQIDVSTLESGLYFLSLTSGEETEVKRFIKI